MKVIYPVLFYEEENGQYSSFVPDLGNISTYGDTLEEAMEMTQDLIAGNILDKIENEEKIAKPSKIENISFKKLEDDLDVKDWNYKDKFKTYILVDIDSFAEKWGKELVKKTVNIPKWVNTKAEERKINFSKTLEEALITKIMEN